MKHIKFIIAVAITAISTYIVINSLELKNLKMAFLNSKPHIWVIPATIIYSAAFFLRALRWKIILGVKTTIPRFLPYTLTGFFLNAVLPFRAGEAAKALAVSKRFNLNIATTLSSVIIERWFDLMFFAVTGVLFLSHILNSSIPLILAVITIPLIFIIIKEIQLKMPEKYILKKIVEVVYTLKNSIKNMNPVNTLSITLLSCAIWLLEAINFMVIAEFFDIELNLKKTLMVMFFMATGVALPQAPGYIGTFEGFGMLGFKFIGMENQNIPGFLISLHAFQLGFIIITGGLSFIKIL